MRPPKVRRGLGCGATITDYIEWRAFAFWVRLIVGTEGGVSPEMRALLEDRCPGFLDDAEAYRRAHPRETRVPVAAAHFLA